MNAEVREQRSEVRTEYPDGSVLTQGKCEGGYWDKLEAPGGRSQKLDDGHRPPLQDQDKPVLANGNCVADQVKVPLVAEKVETIEAQLKWLRQGKRKAVFIPQFSVMEIRPRLTLGPGFRALPVENGLFIYDDLKISAADIICAVAKDRIGEVLGYGVEKKPAQPAGAVVVRDEKGLEKQAVVVDGENVQQAVTAAEAVKDEGDTVRLERCQNVIEKRTQEKTSLVDRFPWVKPIKTAEELNFVAAALQKDGHKPMFPTHYIERDGEVVGALAIQSIPLWTGWIRSDLKARDSAIIINSAENILRANGQQVGIALVTEESPFNGNMEAFGYKEMVKGTLHGKRL